MNGFLKWSGVATEGRMFTSACYVGADLDVLSVPLAAVKVTSDLGFIFSCPFKQKLLLR